MGSKSKKEEPREELPTGVRDEERIEAKIVRDLQDSFPASDPHGLVLGVERSVVEPEAKENCSSPDD